MMPRHTRSSLFAGSIRYPQSPIEAVGKRNDDSRYAHLSPIASVKTTRLTIVPSQRPEITQERDGQSSEIGACFLSVNTALTEGRSRKAVMTIRSRQETIIFKHPFRIRGIDRLLPAGSYEVITDEEMIEGLSFAAFRRVATMIKVPAEGGSAIEMISIGSVDLSDAQRIDASAPDV
jgi:hypothetical protein